MGIDRDVGNQHPYRSGTRDVGCQHPYRSGAIRLPAVLVPAVGDTRKSPVGLATNGAFLSAPWGGQGADYALVARCLPRLSGDILVLARDGGTIHRIEIDG